MINYHDTVVSYNKQAMNALKNQQVAVAFNLLGQAEKILMRKELNGADKLIALTYNNFGCLFKKTGDYVQAIKSFNKAILQNRTDLIKKAGTYLNLSNIYSILVDHEKALNAAKQALEHLRVSKEESEDYNFSLVTAYQAIAFENENLSQYLESEIYYKKALKLIRKKLLGDELFDRISEKYRILQSKMTTSITNSSKTIDNLRPRRIFTNSTPQPALCRGPKQNFSFEVEKPSKNKNLFQVSPASRNSSKRNEYNAKGKITLKCESEDWKIKKKQLRGHNKRLIIMKKNKKSIRTGRVVSKTPEVIPVPYKNKLHLINTLE